MSTAEAVVVALMGHSVPSIRRQARQKILRSTAWTADSSVCSPAMAAVPNDGLDDVDRRLLELLAADARMSNARLAAAVGVAPSTALARVRALRERGVIRGFHAEVDLAALGRPLQALVAIRLSVHSREQIESFTEHVRTLAGVLSIFHVTGQTDYLLWVAAADAHDLREFVVEHLASDPAVAHAETSLIYEQRRGPGGLLRAARARRVRGRPGLAGSAGLRAALAQEALELARDGVATGEVLRAHLRLLLLGRLLKALDEGLHVGVALHGERDLALVVDGRGLELARVDRDADEASSLRTRASAAFGLGAAAT
jgi:DNA-binding Lrp family transcriptional regulator